MTSLLFETPTGFTVFNFYAMNFFVPNAIEVIWVNFAEHFLAQKVTALFLPSLIIVTTLIFPGGNCTV
ncbi:hypothetical protein BRADI_1g17552v3 [Brachypodium distachyon]|uniref:Uncharacterized protein n=1 Tax=Brachypodium distachyon TaxID=15368 RepID=A0A2K2DJV6_BRADI|nr:hypothetical protein BRADI_1g17552v3 [Brachypodium distachyon]